MTVISNALASTRCLSKLRQVPLVLIAAASLSGCGLFGSSKPKPPELPELKNSAVSIEWSASTGKSSGFNFMPGFAEQLVYAASYDDGIYAFAEEGAARLRASIPRCRV